MLQKWNLNSIWFAESFIFNIGRISDSPKPHILDEDVDVAEERERIYKSEKTNDILRIRDLSKVRFFACFSFFLFSLTVHHEIGESDDWWDWRKTDESNYNKIYTSNVFLVLFLPCVARPTKEQSYLQ